MHRHTAIPNVCVYSCVCVCVLLNATKFSFRSVCVLVEVLL